MVVKKGLILKEVAGNYIVVAVGSAVKLLGGAVTLNSTGAFLWSILEKGAEIDDLVNALTKNYKVDNATAKKDAVEFIDKLQKANLLD